MSVRAKREYVQAIYARYRRARRPDKGRILDEFCAITRCHRKHALRVLNGPAPGAEHPPRHRPVQYGPAVIEALRAIWEAPVIAPLRLHRGTGSPVNPIAIV